MGVNAATPKLTLRVVRFAKTKLVGEAEVSKERTFFGKVGVNVIQLKLSDLYYKPCPALFQLRPLSHLSVLQCYCRAKETLFSNIINFFDSLTVANVGVNTLSLVSPVPSSYRLPL